MRARAHAKINLGLQVGALGKDGYHQVHSLLQSVSWDDEIDLRPGEKDEVEVHGAGVPSDERNLAWRALLEARELIGGGDPVELVLDKHIPVAAGLGGGSADAATVLAMADELWGLGDDAIVVAAGLGADVPFCFLGGTAVVSGRGDVVAPVPSAGPFAAAIVVPPVELATAAVYAEWDRLNGPIGPQIRVKQLPPSLRSHGPLANDLYPAAVSLSPALEDWRGELAGRWSLPVAMTGSGAGLFSLFVAVDEAEDAIGAIPPGARAARAVEALDVGWEITER